MEIRQPLRAASRLRALKPSQCANTAARRNLSHTPSPRKQEEKWKQVHPVGGFYESLLTYPLSQITSATATAQPTTSPPPAPPPKTAKEETLAKARIVFGSRLAGPAERREELKSKSTVIAGVTVPPKPEEPDNCCMSGCVNCVWDRFAEEVEEYALKSAEAQAALAAQESGGAGVEQVARTARPGVRADVPVSMDDDGGGSETNWTPSGEVDEKLFEGVPVGILAFMKQERKLKLKHMREGTKG
jgi:hypothetical protein